MRAKVAIILALIVAVLASRNLYADPRVSYGSYWGPPIEDITLNLPKMNELQRYVNHTAWNQSILPIKIRIVEFSSTAAQNNEFPWKQALLQAVAEIENLTNVEVDKKNFEWALNGEEPAKNEGNLEVRIKDVDEKSYMGENTGPISMDCSSTNDYFYCYVELSNSGSFVTIKSINNLAWATFYQEIGEALAILSSSYLEIPRYVELSQMGEMVVANSFHPLDRQMAVINNRIVIDAYKTVQANMQKVETIQQAPGKYITYPDKNNKDIYFVTNFDGDDYISDAMKAIANFDPTMPTLAKQYWLYQYTPSAMKDILYEHPEIWRTNRFYVPSWLDENMVIHTTLHLPNLDTGDDYWYDAMFKVSVLQDGTVQARLLNAVPVDKPADDRVATEVQQYPFVALHFVRLALGNWDDELVTDKYIYADFIMADANTLTFNLYRYGFVEPGEEDRVFTSPYNAFSFDDGMEARYGVNDPYNDPYTARPSNNLYEEPYLDPFFIGDYFWYW